MKPDISTRSDIKKLITLFYDKVKTDPEIGFFFSEVININWQEHLPLMCRFWENVLFHTGDYEGNPLEAHRNLHTKHPTSTKHFRRWIQLFNSTIDAYFSGANAEKMKQHAQAIAQIMQQKI